jgi:hypothetical protein
MRYSSALSWSAFLGATLAGCGSSSTSTFSCDATTMVGPTTVHICTEDDDVPASSVDGLTADCEDATGTVVTACTSKGLLGACTIAADGSSPASATIRYYDDGGLTAVDAQLECMADGGTWADGG